MKYLLSRDATYAYSYILKQNIDAIVTNKALYGSLEKNILIDKLSFLRAIIKLRKSFNKNSDSLFIQGYFPSENTFTS